MNTRTTGLSRFVAAAGATVIGAIGTWAFVSASAAIERDPFHFASIMAANAKVRTAQLQSTTVSPCANNPEIRDHRSLVCLRG